MRENRTLRSLRAKADSLSYSTYLLVGRSRRRHNSRPITSRLPNEAVNRAFRLYLPYLGPQENRDWSIKS